MALSTVHHFFFLGPNLYVFCVLNCFVSGDITKKTLANLTGDDDYQFGDITKKALGNLFGKKGKK